LKFNIVIHKDPESDYGVTVPDLPGCFSAGSSVDEALNMAKEAIELHLQGMQRDGETIPSAIPVERHRRNPLYQDGMWAVVEVDVREHQVE
jgi:predicted RNase H-like HicB family nuclease